MNRRRQVLDPQVDEEWGIVSADTLQGERGDTWSVLAGVQVFESLSPEELGLVDRIVHRRVYNPREVIVNQGVPGVGMYIIESGSAEVVLDADDGRRTRLATLTDGNFFGEMSLLDGSPRAASVIATERSQLIGFFRADLMDLIARSPRLGFKIVSRITQLLAERLRSTVKEYRSLEASLGDLEVHEQKDELDPSQV